MKDEIEALKKQNADLLRRFKEIDDKNIVVLTQS